MPQSTRGGMTITDGGAAKAGTALFGTSDLYVRFLTMFQTSSPAVDWEFSIDGGNTYIEVKGTEGRVNLPLPVPVRAKDILARPYTDGQTLTLIATGISERVS